MESCGYVPISGEVMDPLSELVTRKSKATGAAGRRAELRVEAQQLNVEESRALSMRKELGFAKDIPFHGIA